jgi:hypothetical protein
MLRGEFGKISLGVQSSAQEKRYSRVDFAQKQERRKISQNAFPPCNDSVIGFGNYAPPD